MTVGRFPNTRMRRNRRDAWTRRLVAENTLSVGDLIWPIFVIEGENTTTDVGSMPGVQRVTVDRLAAHCANAHLYGSLAQMYEMRMPEGEGTEAAEAGRGHECLVDDQRSSGQGSARLHSRHILNYFFPKSLI